MHRMSSVSRACGVLMAGVCAAGPLAAIAGAAPPGARAVEAGPSTIKVAPTDVERLRSPVEVSLLRERALDLLMASTEDSYDLARATSLEALQLAPGRLGESVAKATKDRNAGVRSAAAMMIGRAKLKARVEDVRPLLADEDPRVRASAIYALDACGVEVDQTPLAGMVLGDPSARARSHAAFILGELGNPSAQGLLREGARTSVPRTSPAEVRLMQLQIAEALVKLGDESQMEVIRAALYPARPEDLEATALAVQIIGQLKDRGSIDSLIYLTATKDRQGNRMPAEIRLGAAGALARMGMTQGTFLADEFAGHPQAPLRVQAAYVYGEIGRAENLAKLELMLKDSDPSVRVSAAAAILKIASSQIPNR